MRLLVVVAGDAEGLAGAAWAEARRGWRTTVVDVRVPLPTLDDFDAVWIHGDTMPSLTTEDISALDKWLEAGGGIVLSLSATLLSARFGYAGEPPSLATDSWSDNDDPLWGTDFRDWPEYPHIRGFQGWPNGEHPLFRGLMSGTFTWAPLDGEEWSAALFTRPAWPDGHARVVAVERAYVQLNSEAAVAWEYERGKGRVLCLGAHVRFGAADRRFADQLDRLMTNALEDATSTARGDQARERASWPEARDRHAAVGVLPRARRLPLATSPRETWLGKNSSSIDESPFTLAAQNLLVAGTERDGMSEVWIHPLCVVRSFNLQIDGENTRAHEFQISPAGSRRIIRTPTGRVFEELIESDPNSPVLFWQIRPLDGRSLERGSLELTLGVPLALEWPMPTDALHPMRTEIVDHESAHVVVVTGRDALHVAAIFIDGFARPEILEEGRDGPTVRLTSTDTTGVSLAFTASTTGLFGIPAPATIDDALDRQSKRWNDVATRSTRLVSSQVALDEAWNWGVARLANFMAWSPYHNVRGLMAGYAESKPGWGRSRPGYAWFFGRDTCWCLDALLAAGMHEEARDAIGLLVETADVTGKIAHEITTSGIVHYDAADSTPLLLRAIAAYVEWTADIEQLSKWWPAVEKALEYCVSCDRDGDGIPENTGVGHGWVESGPLGGGATTSYVAAIWIDALAKLQEVAQGTGRETIAQGIRSMLLAATAGIERLRDPHTGWLALHRSADGRMVTDLTALAAVPVALGVENLRAADEIVDALADSSFTTAWGLRMLSATDPRYNPRGYHTGSVWPLFTGWAALADARRGRSERALDRITSIASLVQSGCKGAFDEILDGNDGSSAGVCPDQAWSASMMISPVIYGLFGLKPNALRDEVTIAPSIPEGLESLSVENLRIGDNRLTITCSKAEAGAILAITSNGGSKHLHALIQNQRLRLAPNEETTIVVGRD